MADTIDYTPIQKYNKKLKEATKELNNETKNLKKPFQKLAEDLGKINKDFAKIAINAVKEDSDTFQGLITKRRVQAEINARKEDKEYQQQNKKLQEFQKRETKLAEEQYQRQLKFQTDRQKIFEQDRIGFGSLRDLNQKKLEEETKLQNASVKERSAIQDKLSELDKKISDRQELVAINLERKYQSETEANEKQIELEKKNIAKTEEFVNTYNEEFDKKIKELQETPNYDKFTGAIKQLTGGIVDIDSFLNPIAKTFKSLGDLKDVTKDAVSGISNFMTKNKESSLVSEKLEEARQKKEDKRDKKRERSGNRFALGLNGFTILLAAAGLTLAAFIAKSDRFASTLSDLLGLSPEPSSETDTDNLTKMQDVLDGGGSEDTTPPVEGVNTTTDTTTPPVGGVNVVLPTTTDTSTESNVTPTPRLLSDEEKIVLEDGIDVINQDLDNRQRENTDDLVRDVGTSAAANVATARITTSVSDAVMDVRTSPTPVRSFMTGVGNVASDTAKVLKGSGLLSVAGAYFTAQDIKQMMDSNEEFEEEVMKAYEEGAFNFEKGEHPEFPDLTGQELYELVMKNLENKKNQDSWLPWISMATGVAATWGAALLGTGSSYGTAGGILIPAAMGTSAAIIADYAGDQFMGGNEFLEEYSNKVATDENLSGTASFITDDELERRRDEAQDLLDAQPETVIDKINAKNIEDLSLEERRIMNDANRAARNEVMMHGGVVQQNTSSANVNVIRTGVINNQRYNAMTRHARGGFRYR